MKTISKSLLLIISGFFISLAGFSQSLNFQEITGNWSGELELPSQKLELIFKISVDSTGELVTKMDVPMQGAKDLPVTKTELKGDSLKIAVGMIMGEYMGKIVDDSTLTGTWSQRGAKLPLTLTKKLKVAELQRPQTPKPPYPYMSENVEYINPESKLKLAGTLTLPKEKGKFPAVVLITGSGAQDRDETIFEHRPFAVIADYLTRNGIAVLRVDDRGVGGSEGNINNATSEDFAGDVIAGIQFLKTRPEINHQKIGLIGHSEGGIIAPIVANRTEDVAFLVLLAGPGIRGEEILYQQNERSLKAAGMSDEMIRQNRQLQENIFRIVLNEKDSAMRIDKLQRTLSGGMYTTMSKDQKEAIDTQLEAMNTPWFRFFLTYDPYPALTKVGCPVLALIGENDVQVPAETNLPAIEKALKEGGNTDFKILKPEKLNHLFQTSKTGAISEYGQIEETFSPNALELLENWIWEVVK